MLCNRQPSSLTILTVNLSFSFRILVRPAMSIVAYDPLLKKDGLIAAVVWTV